MVCRDGLLNRKSEFCMAKGFNSYVSKHVKYMTSNEFALLMALNILNWDQLFKINDNVI